MQQYMNDSFERYDMTEPPRHTKWYLRPLLRILSLPDLLIHRNRLTKAGMENIKPPYLLLCNHNAFMDFKVAVKAISPYCANYVVAIDGFIGREKLLRDIGCICTRKFTSDITLVRNLAQTVKNGDVAIMYPEARYSLCGTTAVLPESIGKLAKLLKVPVVTLMCHGHHVNSPFWNLRDRRVAPTEAEMELLLTPGQVAEKSVEEINRLIVDKFQYDDYQWLYDRKISIKYKKRAEGLHKILYKCPVCGTEFKMGSKGTELFCNSCGSRWLVNEYMRLIPESPAQKGFEHVPDWYEWERAEVRKEIEAGTYSSGTLRMHVKSLPNAKKFIDLGKGTLVHDMDGFRAKCTAPDGTEYEMHKSVPSLYSCHIEYEYLGKYGDCVDLNTLTDTWYVFPDEEDFAVTKMALATEELYFYDKKEKGREIKPGLA
ncbi:MAG: 1-acyl-sn-glycerol-3-phosphate acyltransferase [Clostridia bacterium]|nr:1-acyl-sn-glycerol-3-phosphate acyltransferase [Clostridia bacterium]